ncbi:hypothetical protein DL95DRAFT_405094 [Leptodontidium sp. 2 PMI_412]|nr:hypothetical protein DL95DRAFT_405094 [Leptodontidium sp. 2 PMI_412]
MPVAVVGFTVAAADGGAKTESMRMIAASKDFCNEMKGNTFKPGYVHTGSYPFPYNGGFMSIKIDFQFSIPNVNTLLGRDLVNAQLYSWEYDFDECMKYLSVPRDSCNCGGVDNKQGGVVTNKALNDGDGMICSPDSGQTCVHRAVNESESCETVIAGIDYADVNYLLSPP